MGSGDMCEQSFYVPINDATDSIAPGGVGPAVSGLVPLYTLQDSFKEVTSYSKFGVLNVRWFSVVR